MVTVDERLDCIEIAIVKLTTDNCWIKKMLWYIILIGLAGAGISLPDFFNGGVC
jgi:hypothetical protein